MSQVYLEPAIYAKIYKSDSHLLNIQKAAGLIKEGQYFNVDGARYQKVGGSFIPASEESREVHYYSAPSPISDSDWWLVSDIVIRRAISEYDTEPFVLDSAEVVVEKGLELQRKEYLLDLYDAQKLVTTTPDIDWTYRFIKKTRELDDFDFSDLHLKFVQALLKLTAQGHIENKGGDMTDQFLLEVSGIKISFHGNMPYDIYRLALNRILNKEFFQ